MSVLVVSKIFRLFVNTLTPNEQDSFSVKGNFNATNAKDIIEETEDVFSFLY